MSPNRRNLHFPHDARDAVFKLVFRLGPIPSYLLLRVANWTPVENLSSPKTYEMHFRSALIITALISASQQQQKVSETSTGTPFVLNPEQAPQFNKGFLDWLMGLLGFGDSQIETGSEPVEPPKNCPTCTCGLTYKNKRIVGGVETQINEYPWMIALTYNSRFYCGASLINNKYLITAAHCVNGFAKERLGATFLDHDRSNHFETKTFTRSITKVYRHRHYSSGGSFNNDIALLKLDKDVPMSGMMRPVCLPPTGKSFTGHTGVVVGWGATQAHGQVSNTLREVKVPILSNIDCRRTGYGNRITDNMMCAGYSQGMKDSCQGDSGGPLHVVNGTTHMIVGIVSWGDGCAQPNYPGVYTRVNRFISWIRSNTRDACYC